MVRARRSGVYNVQAVGGGGGPPPTPGNFVTGPDYGQNPKGVDPDGKTFDITLAADLLDISVSGDVAVGLAVDLNDVALSGGSALALAVDLDDVAVEGGGTLGVAADLDDVSLSASLAQTLAVDLDDVATSGGSDLTLAVDLDDVAVEGGGSVSLAVDGTIVLTGMLADEDTWLDEANGTTAHGADTTLQAKTSTLVGNNEQVAYIAWDLTSVVPGGSITSASIDLTVSTDAGLGSSIDWEFYTSASKPFEEDTATWDADEPPSGTQRQTGSISTSTTPSTETITLDATSRANMKGNWCWLRMSSGTALGLATESITSKEGSTGTTYVGSLEDASSNAKDLTLQTGTLTYRAPDHSGASDRYAAEGDGATGLQRELPRLSSLAAPYTIEAWVLADSLSGSDWCFEIRQNLNHAARATIYLNGGSPNSIRCSYKIGTNSERILISSTAPSLSTWYHVAMTVTSSGGTLWVDGTSEASSATAPVTITNAYMNALGSSGTDGVIDSLFLDGAVGAIRVSDVERYTTSFTPDNDWTSDSNTVALYRFETPVPTDIGPDAPLLDLAANLT